MGFPEFLNQAERRQSGSCRRACRTYRLIALRSPASRSGAARGKMPSRTARYCLAPAEGHAGARRISRSPTRRCREPGDGEVLVRGIYLSLDPYMRGRISDVRSYATAGRDRRGHRRPRRRSGRGLARSALQEGDYVFGGLAGRLQRGAGERPAQLDPARGAALDRARGARHAGHDRLFRA